MNGSLFFSASIVPFLVAVPERQEHDVLLLLKAKKAPLEPPASEQAEHLFADLVFPSDIWYSF
jgi:hypothetical protein